MWRGRSGRRRSISAGGVQSGHSRLALTPSRFLYLVQPGGRALRYGIGVGRPGFTWSGMKTARPGEARPADADAVAQGPAAGLDQVEEARGRIDHLVQPGGRALRYGIGVGRPGFTWSGMKTVSAKREAVDAVERRAEIERAGAQRVGGAAGHVARQVGAAAARRSTASTAPTSPTRSASRSRPAASG
jgi:hypothetical protein